LIFSRFFLSYETIEWVSSALTSTLPFVSSSLFLLAFILIYSYLIIYSYNFKILLKLDTRSPVVDFCCITLPQIVGSLLSGFLLGLFLHCFQYAQHQHSNFNTTLMTLSFSTGFESTVIPILYLHYSYIRILLLLLMQICFQSQQSISETLFSSVASLIFAHAGMQMPYMPLVALQEVILDCITFTWQVTKNPVLEACRKISRQFLMSSYYGFPCVWLWNKCFASSVTGTWLGFWVNVALNSVSVFKFFVHMIMFLGRA